MFKIKAFWRFKPLILKGLIWYYEGVVNASMYNLSSQERMMKKSLLAIVALVSVAAVQARHQAIKIENDAKGTVEIQMFFSDGTAQEFQLRDDQKKKISLSKGVQLDSPIRVRVIDGPLRGQRAMHKPSKDSHKIDVEIEEKNGRLLIKQD